MEGLLKHTVNISKRVRPTGSIITNMSGQLKVLTTTDKHERPFEKLLNTARHELKALLLFICISLSELERERALKQIST